MSSGRRIRYTLGTFPASLDAITTAEPAVEPIAARYLIALIAGLLVGVVLFVDVPVRRIGARYLVPLVAAVIAGVIAFCFVPEPLPELTRSEFLAEVRAGHVREVEIEDQDIIIAESSTRGRFRTAFHRREDIDLPAELRALGVEVRFSKSPPGV